MRLLTHNSDGEIELTKFDDDKAPRYAILSHTWGNDEVLFEDMINHTEKCPVSPKNKLGYRKIVFCGDQASRDGLQYFWVDTCCINKTNSAELNESVNSMFRWYRDAAVCYVYLADVSVPTLESRRIRSSWEPAFRTSRWFRRGWTLQELIAPNLVEFFSKEGIHLGSKRSLEGLIYEITEVPAEAFWAGQDLTTFTVEERLAWMRTRQTTRDEDGAYCLLGIFGVTMPLAYGEGRATAFGRLLQRVAYRCLFDLRTTDPRLDKLRIESVNGAPPKDSYRWILDHNDFRRWRDNASHRLLYIKGDPGQGKTMLLCGIVNELGPKTRLQNSENDTLLSYFFCEATDLNMNNATAVLSGLIFLLVEQQLSLISHVQKKYNHMGKAIFDDANTWTALSEILMSIMDDPNLKTTYIIIDALDECETGLDGLLKLINRNMWRTRVKWIVSSRNRPDIERHLKFIDSQALLSLDLNDNTEHVLRATNMYIDNQVSRLVALHDIEALRDKISRVLHQKSDGTLLSVANVVTEIKHIKRSYVPTWLDNRLPGYGANKSRYRPKLSGETHAVDNVTDSGYGGSGASKTQSRSRAFNESMSVALVPAMLESAAEDAGHETETVYSNTESLKDLKSRDYVTAFVDVLCGSLPSSFDKIEFEKVSPIFDELLRAFADKVRYDGNTSEHLNLTYLVHRYHSQITENLRQRYDDDPDQRDTSSLDGHDDMTIEDKMSLLWKDAGDDTGDREISDDGLDGLPDEGLDDIPAEGPDGILDDDIDVDITQLPPLENYREIIMQSPAYRWLLWQIATADRLECPGPFNVQKAIRDTILEGLGPQKQFSRRMSPHVKVEYHIDWNLSAFHAEQEYACTVEQVLEQAITITGLGNDVQAATCLDYVGQTWGETGVNILRILQETVLDSAHADNFPPGGAYAKQDSRPELSISASYKNGMFTISASGIPYLVAEVGELLAWLGASLRSSNKRGAVSCRPVALFVHRNRAPATDTRLCKIGFELHDLNKSVWDGSSGSCWLGCFRNPVVVEGYPIPRRLQAGSGLEVSIGIMTSLANATYMADFCQRTFLKGFSTMLAVIEIIGSTVFWHLFYNSDNTYISYEDARVPRDRENQASSLTLDRTALSMSRHILGWCQNVHCHAGTRYANYDIGWSRLGPPRSAVAFEKVTITAGQVVNAGTSLQFGIKDKPEHIIYDDDYLSTLQMISERHFVFYDIEDRRAWLLDGASTLLHLLRAFIKYSQTKSRLKDFFLFKDDDLQEADESRRAGDAAIFVLANEDNQRLPLWRKMATQTDEITMKFGSKAEEAIKYKTAYFCLKDRALQICRVLQRIIAHQDDVHSRDGVGARVKMTMRRQLEGFDFMDVATNQGTLWPRVDYIHSRGEGWVDFTRKLHCVTLFGTRFGELMRPVGDPCQLCMSNIPQQPDLLGITVADLRSIIEKRGNDKLHPWRVVEDIYWYVPDMLFEPCWCDPTLSERNASPSTRCDRVQVFLPSRHPKLWSRGLRPPQLAHDGAILVGHSFKYPLRWGTSREPAEGEPEIPDENNDSPFQDSGMDSSYATENPESPGSTRYLQSVRSPLRRPSPHGAGSSDSGIFLQPNQPFVYYGQSPESNLAIPQETALIPPSSSSAGEQGTDDRLGERRGQAETARRPQEREHLSSTNKGKRKEA